MAWLKIQEPPEGCVQLLQLVSTKSNELPSKARRKQRSREGKKYLRRIASQLFEAKPSRSEPCLILITLRISQTPIHMLQRTQRLLIFLPVPGPSDDKSETQRNHTSLMNQPTNEEQRSLAKMTTSPVTASNILEAWGGRPQG